MTRLIQRCVKADGLSSLVIPPETTRHAGRKLADWKAGRTKLPDADDAVFMPLPNEPALTMPSVKGV